MIAVAEESAETAMVEGYSPSEPGALATGIAAPLLPARLETEDGRQRFAMFGSGPGGAWRLVCASILLGKKVRVILLQSDKREFLVGTAHVLRTLRLSEGLYENGATILTPDL